jgi:CubicO group peptidase (beta-lactamase class C family)
LVRNVSIASLVLVGIAVSVQPASAQGLSFSVFAGYLESFRAEAAIPGMSAAILQDGVLVWERGFGKQDVDANISASPDTPYAIGQLSQAFGATLLLRKCIDQSYARLTDRVVRWTPQYPETSTTLAQLLSHTSPSGTYQYAPDRFAALTGVIEECVDLKYREILADDVFDFLSMTRSVPGQSYLSPAPDDINLLGQSRVDRYGTVLRDLAVPYRVVSRRAQRNLEFPTRPVDAADGIVSTVRDLAKFDQALDAGLLLQPSTRDLAWTQSYAGSAALPTGLGWFVQAYNGQPVVWQFGSVDGAYSSLIVKVLTPNRRLTFILLANSDGLSVPFTLSAGDVTTSTFARLFLKSFVP